MVGERRAEKGSLIVKASELLPAAEVTVWRVSSDNPVTTPAAPLNAYNESTRRPLYTVVKLSSGLFMQPLSGLCARGGLCEYSGRRLCQG